MVESNKKSLKDILASISLIVGLITGIGGVVLTSHSIYSIFHKPEPSQASEEQQAKNTALKIDMRASEPHIDIEYVCIDLELYRSIINRRKISDDKQNMLLSYPIQPNEIASDQELTQELMTGTESPDRIPDIRIVCLLLQHRGKREASDVKLTVNRVQLSEAVSVTDLAGTEKEDYETKIREKTVKTDKRSFTLGSIDTGGGALIPIFIMSIDSDKKGHWKLISKIAYIPETVSFVDDASQTTKESKVRKMHDPVMLTNGVLIRG